MTDENSTQQSGTDASAKDWPSMSQSHNNKQHHEYQEEDLTTAAYPKPDEVCTSCKEKECYVVTSGNKKKKQKADFKWIDCDVCQLWFHGTCQELKPSEVNNIIRLASKGVKRYCEECTVNTQQTGTIPHMKKLCNIEKMVITLQGKVDDYRKETNEQAVCLKKSWAEIANNGQIAKDMKRTMQASTTTQALLAANLEKKDMEERKNNAIIYGLTEKKTAMEDVTELMQKDLFKSFNKPVQAIRLSRKADDKTRPLKLVFSDEKAKWDFMKRVNHSLRSENMFCKLDANKDTRDEEFQSREHIRARNKDENNQHQHRIRNLTIEKKIAASGKWEPLKPAEINQPKRTTF